MKSQNPMPAHAADLPRVPAGTVMTKEFAQLFAQDVYVWGWPIVNAFHRRTSFSAAPEPGLIGGVLPAAPTGYVAMLSHYIDPTERWVAHPNQDVVYGFGYGAVDDDPVVLQVPDFGDRFWVYALYDARSDEFSTLGKQYNTVPGNYLVVGPNWDGAVPEGITDVLRSPTELVAMGPRVFLDDTDADREAIQSVLNQVVLYPLKDYTGHLKTVDWRTVPHFPAGDSTAGETRWVDPETFFDELPGILDRVPALPGEEARYAMMRALLSAAASDPDIAAAITHAAKKTETEVISPLFDFRTNGQVLPGGWNTPVNVARWGFDYLTRTATAKSNMYVNQPEETRYFFLEIDSEGRRLHGDHDHTITFAAGQVPPVDGFWSLTMYNTEHFFAPNDLGRYSLGTKNKTMKYEPDGSLTIRIQHQSPGTENEANWLPAPRGEFELTIRTYWPKPEVNTGTWAPPPVHRNK
ncbi:DUF1214 domain-containing protein [Rhodococcus sp. IEGM 1304]|uniref:DUF1254 domain-containing protein n=1 Tax=Rhodococcus sp. IEGM 1304 TaxID=3082227 RepID=UPI0029540BD8|nr:DUF1214 domain-containing protein [Rhodococcus sp. IEGM 1304]MDV8129121.1 DUF1214 domain-containing protein [Rhodococcus sp. IEGM 1304]